MFLADESGSMPFGEVVAISLLILMVVLFIALTILFLNLLVNRHVAYVTELEKMGEARTMERKQEALEHQRELASGKAALVAEYEQKQQELAEKSRASLALAVVEVRKVAEERYKRTITAEGLEGLDQRLRDAQMVQTHIGRVLTVRVYLVPTGWVTIEWMLDAALPYPLKVICRRGEVTAFAECAYKGMWGDILPLGQEYTFRFEAIDGKTDREDGLAFSITIPTEAEWKRKIHSEIENATQRRERIEQKIESLIVDDDTWEKGLEKVYQQIDSSNATKDEKKKRKARLDAWIARERDEDGG